MTTVYQAIIEPTRTGYSAYVPDVPGCVATGATINETRTKLEEALNFHFECMIEDGLTPPAPVSDVLSVESTVAGSIGFSRDAGDDQMMQG